MPAGECLFCTEDLTDTLAAQGVGMAAARVRPAGGDLGGLVATLVAAGYRPEGDPPPGPPAPAAG